METENGTPQDPKHSNSSVTQEAVCQWNHFSYLIADQTNKKISRVNSEVFCLIFSVHIQPNTSELVRRCFRWHAPQKEKSITSMNLNLGVHAFHLHSTEAPECTIVI